VSVSFGCVSVYHGFEAWIALTYDILAGSCDEKGEQLNQCRESYDLEVDKSFEVVRTAAYSHVAVHEIFPIHFNCLFPSRQTIHDKAKSHGLMATTSSALQCKLNQKIMRNTIDMP